jgi:NAD(P)-dependent dehydrogenase (short-subunit alcohol dehydrogenase family)
MERLRNKVALITGGTAGIGRATAVRFAAEGARIVITGRNPVEAERTLELVRAAGTEGTFEPQDVTREADWARVMSAVDARFGRLDVLVNNAGSFFIKPLEDTSLEDFRSLWSINVEAVFLGTRAAFPLMARGAGGSIVNVASLAGLLGLDKCVAYCSSKAGCVQFTRAAALEGAPLDIRVNVVTPGPVWTDMIAKQYGDTPQVRAFFSEDQPLKVLGLPEDVANGILYLASDEARYVTGTTLTIDAGRGAD